MRDCKSVGEMYEGGSYGMRVGEMVGSLSGSRREDEMAGMFERWGAMGGGREVG